MLTYYDHVLNEDRIATSNAMDDFLTGVGFASSCSESTHNTQGNIISIDPFMPIKFAI